MARAADWTTASEWRQAIDPIATTCTWPSMCPLWLSLGPWPLWLLPSLVGQMPKSGVWGLGSGFRLRTVHRPPYPYSVAPRPFRLPHQQ